MIQNNFGTDSASPSYERTSDIADKSIVNVCWRKNTLRSSKLKVLKLPDMGVLETTVTTAEEAEKDKEEEQAEVAEEFWDDVIGEL